MADFVKTAPLLDCAILCSAAAVPLRGPDALYRQAVNRTPARVVDKSTGVLLLEVVVVRVVSLVSLTIMMIGMFMMKDDTTTKTTRRTQMVVWLATTS